MMDYPASYVAFDTETTGLTHADQIIEIGAVRVLDGEPVAVFSTFIRPDCAISDATTRITGITPAMVADAPCAASVIPDFLSFVGDLPIVGHNIAFDRRFLVDACAMLDLCPPQNDFIDTLKMARDRYPELNNHRLSTIALTLGVPQETAHRAVDDADVTRQCYEALRRISLPRRRKTVRPTTVSRPFYHWRPVAHPDLGGASICITGELSALPRDAAHDFIRSLNGQVKLSVSKHLDYLVVSPPYDPASSSKTGKVLAAEAVIAAGAPLRLITEYDLMTMLGFEWVDVEPGEAVP